MFHEALSLKFYGEFYSIITLAFAAQHGENVFRVETYKLALFLRRTTPLAYTEAK